jgi:hypothetical protein
LPVGTLIREVSSVTTIEFRAPWSNALQIVTIVASGILVLMTGIAAILVAKGLAPPYASLMIVLPPLLLAAALLYRVRGYTLTDDAIIVRRIAGNCRLRLAGLLSVAGDAEAMRGSLRLLGNWGLFSITGRYWNRKLGSYRAFATDPSRAVVLRYSNETVVITPHDPQHFIMRARTLLKAADFPK